MKQLVCPKCLRTVEVTDSAVAACTHGRPAGRLNPPVTMIPLTELATN